MPVQGVQVRLWTYLSDGLRVKGELFLPPVKGRCPVVVFCHDGISGISREHRLSSIRLARAGYVVFAPSYRGEDGSDGMVEVAKGEVDDVLNVLPLLARLPEADGDKIALAGASHGALIATLAASRSERVRALVTAYGVMDIYKWWAYLRDRGKLGHDPVSDRTYGDGPQARPESFAIRNALNVVDHIHCPVLILQGGKDDIVPPEQAVLLKDALDQRHKSAQLALYPDCLHGFLVYAPYLSDVKPAERRQTEASWKTMLDFLGQSLRSSGTHALEVAPPTPAADSTP